MFNVHCFVRFKYFVAEGIVCEHNINQEGIIGETDLCGLDHGPHMSDVLNVSCSVKYSGHFTPILCWKTLKDNKIAELDYRKYSLTNETLLNSKVCYNIVKEASKENDNSYFICSVQQFENQLITTSLKDWYTNNITSWRSPEIRLLCKYNYHYFFSLVGYCFFRHH